MTGTDLCVNKPHCAKPVQSSLGVARVMSEQKVPWGVEQRIVIKFLGENDPSAEIHHRLTPTTVWGRASPTDTLFPILLLESVVNFSNEEFDHNALLQAPRYLLFAHHSSNSQTGLNRF